MKVARLIHIAAILCANPAIAQSPAHAGGSAQVGDARTDGSPASARSTAAPGHQADGIQAGGFAGVDPTGATDSTAGLQKAADAAAAAGETLHLAAGLYRTSSTIVLNSDSKLVCAAGATFRPAAYIWVLANHNAVKRPDGSPRDVLKDDTPATAQNQTDHDISVEGCAFDFTDVSGPPSTAGSASIAFYLMRRGRILGNKVIGGTTLTTIGGEFKMMGVDSVEMAGNYGYNGGSLDFFKGSSNFSVHDNTVYLPPANNLPYGPYSCASANGQGPSPSDNETLHDFSFVRNKCYLNGNAQFLNYDTLSPTSIVKNGAIRENIVIALSGADNFGLVGRGNIDNVDITDNTFEGLNHSYVGAVLTGVALSNGGNPFHGVDILSTYSGSSHVVVKAPGLDASSIGADNVVFLGGRLDRSAPVEIGGLSLNGYYRVVGADPSTSSAIVSVAPAVARATVRNGGGAAYMWVYIGTTRNSTVCNNNVVNSTLARGALIDARGPGMVVCGTTIVGGAYGAAVNVDGSSDLTDPSPKPPRVYGTSAAAGTGFAGGTGDNINNYTNQFGARTRPEIRK